MRSRMDKELKVGTSQRMKSIRIEFDTLTEIPVEDKPKALISTLEIAYIHILVIAEVEEESVEVYIDGEEYFPFGRKTNREMAAVEKLTLATGYVWTAGFLDTVIADMLLEEESL